jgi:uncharacterized membrane protein (UPF0182 family)
VTAVQARIPRPSVLWTPVAFWIWVFLIVLAVDALPHLLVQYWFNQSLGYRDIFWTNFRTQITLFLLAGIEDVLAIGLPAIAFAVTPTLRKVLVHTGIWIGVASGWILASHYQEFLLALNGVPFGVLDPIFHHDVGFYVYVLPAVHLVLWAVEASLAFGLLSVCVARYGELVSGGAVGWRYFGIRRMVGAFAVPYANCLIGLLGIAGTLEVFLWRYGLLIKDNAATGVRAGAAYVDVVGALSNLNRIHVLAAAVAGLTVVLVGTLARLHREYRAAVVESLDEPARRNGTDRPPATITSLVLSVRTAVVLVLLPIVFSLAVIVRQWIVVTPNEPTIQREFIARHIEATRRAYRLDRVEVHEWAPPATPLTADALLGSRTVQNAPVLPSWVSSLEQPPDVQHLERIKTSKSTMVFGPLLQIYKQQQQLRPYYDFLSVDGVRYTVNGEKRMFASAVRELPSLALVGQKEWLKYWGSSALQFTHGMGLVMSPVNRLTETGEPTYAVKNVPPVADEAALTHEPRIYIGEGMKDEYVLTHARGLREFDYATPQSRAEVSTPGTGQDGILLDSWLKRVAFAIYTRDFTAFLFSRYIDMNATRVHIRRTPISRARGLLPFLFLDTNSYAFIADGRVVWMVNGLTTTDQYPYSFREVLGDKADERAVEKFPERVINYAEDTVKITIDAYSGRVRIYRIADDPIATTWEKVYPELFEPRRAMPPAIAAQLTYPLQWFHVQFDDIYKRYHQQDPIQFYNVEDLWDDADETLGSLGRGLTSFGTGDQMTFSYEGYNVLLDPADMPPGVDIGRPGDLQYAMLMPFTPEAARNLRSLVIALQDSDSYGRLISLQIPQGVFVPGPEQVDAYIDNDRPVHQQVTMWIRHASEVLRGSTLLLPVGGDLMYVESVWVNSLQNDLPQLKLVAVRYHDRITSGGTLAEAIDKRNLFGPEPRDAWTLEPSANALATRKSAPDGEQQQRGDERGNRRHQPDADKLAQSDDHPEPTARVEPEQAGQRSDRKQTRAEVTANQHGEELARPGLGAQLQSQRVHQRHRVVVKDR